MLGKTKDSPSTRKGKIQKQLQAEKDSRSQYSHRARPSLLSREGSETKVRTLSQHHSARHSAIDLDLSKVGCSTAHQSHRTTDRSSHPRYRSELARQLFWWWLSVNKVKFFIVLSCDLRWTDNNKIIGQFDEVETVPYIEKRVFLFGAIWLLWPKAASKGREGNRD